MASPSDVVPVPVTPLFQNAPFVEPVFDEEVESARIYQEINARRAQIERPELLRTLRGL
jgi:hypothetical protein